MDDEADATGTSAQTTSEHPEVAVVRTYYESLQQRDFDTLFSLLDSDCVITQDPSVPWGGRYEGPDGFVQFGATLQGCIDSQVEIGAVFAADGEVYQYGRTRGTVRGSGTPFDIPEVHRFTIRDGKIVAAHFAIDVDAMQVALGTKPEGHTPHADAHT
jgi:ketosteroid isomerase-like protein